MSSYLVILIMNFVLSACVLLLVYRNWRFKKELTQFETNIKKQLRDILKTIIENEQKDGKN